MSEYPFRFVGILFEERRPQALEDIRFYEERIESACGYLMSRATKEEFMAWVSRIWDQTSIEWNEEMSKPQP